LQQYLNRKKGDSWLIFFQLGEYFELNENSINSIKSCLPSDNERSNELFRKDPNSFKYFTEDGALSKEKKEKEARELMKSEAKKIMQELRVKKSDIFKIHSTSHNYRGKKFEEFDTYSECEEKKDYFDRLKKNTDNLFQSVFERVNDFSHSLKDDRQGTRFGLMMFFLTIISFFLLRSTSYLLGFLGKTLCLI
jgi:hypothetical protein